MLDLVISCIQLLQALHDMRETMKGNWATCIRLCIRCEIFQKFLEHLKENPNLISPSSMKALHELQETLTDIQKFVIEFTSNTMVAMFTRAAFRNSNAQEISELNSRLNDCIMNLNVIQDVDYEN